MKKIIPTLLTLTSTLLCSSELSEPRVLDVSIAGETVGTFLIENNENNEIVFSEEVEYGVCKTDKLKEIAKTYKLSEELLDIIPLEKCLSAKDINFKTEQEIHFVDSKSAFTDYSIVNTNDQTSVNLNHGVWVADTFFTAQSSWDKSKGFKVGNKYALKEYKDMRIKAGDIQGQNLGFVKSEALKGIQISPNKHLQDNTQKLDYEIILDNKSTIDIYNNGEFVKKLELAAGIYQLKDLPLQYFSNEVKIVVTDAFGHKKEYEIPFLFSSNLLAVGKHDYDLSIGVDDNNKVKYSGFYRRGVRDNLTVAVGANSEGKIALEANHINKLGIIGAQVDNKGNTMANISASINNDTRIGASFSNIDGRKSLRASASTRLNSGQLSAKYQKSDEEKAGLSYRTNYKDVGISLDGNYNLTTKDYDASLGLYYNMDTKTRPINITTTSQISNNSKSNYIGVGSSHLTPIGDIKYDAHAENIQQTNGSSSNRYGLSVDSNLKNHYWASVNKNNNNVSTTVGVSGAIAAVYSDGVEFAVGNSVGGESSYIIDDKRGLNSRISPYQTTTASNQFANIPVTLKSGQGYWLDPEYYKNIAGTITLNGEFFSQKKFEINGKEEFTGYDGDFWVEGYIGNIDDFNPKREGIKCKTKISKLDDGMYEAEVICSSNGEPLADFTIKNETEKITKKEEIPNEIEKKELPKEQVAMNEKVEDVKTENIEKLKTISSNLKKKEEKEIANVLSQGTINETKLEIAQSTKYQVEKSAKSQGTILFNDTIVWSSPNSKNAKIIKSLNKGFKVNISGYTMGSDKVGWVVLDIGYVLQGFVSVP